VSASVKMKTYFRGETFWLMIILAAGVFMRCAAIYAFSHPPESDELVYQSMAVNLVNGRGIVDFHGDKAMYNVGYPLFIIAPVFVAFGESLLAVRFSNLFLGILSIYLCYAIAREAGGGRTARLLAAAGWAFYLPANVYTVYLLKENLMTPLMLGVIWCVLRTKNCASLNSAMGCGVLLGLIALVGNAGLSLVSAVLFGFMYAPARWGKKVSLFIVTFVLAVLVAMPWALRNQHVLGAPVLNTNGGFNLYLGNNPLATGMFMSIADTPWGEKWHELRNEKGELAASETMRHEATTWIVTHPAAFFRLALRKIIYFWTPPWHEGKGNLSVAEAMVRFLWLLQFFILVGGALLSLFFLRLRPTQLGVLWTAIIAYSAVHMIFYVTFRYREPIMPLLCILTAIAVEWVVARYAVIMLMRKSLQRAID